MAVQRTGKDRLAYIEIVDLFLSTQSHFPRTAILKAIDNKNFAGLSRVLEMRHGDLDFNVHETFANPRWSNVPMIVKDLDSAFREDMRVRRFDLQNCLAYAEEKGADDFIALLKSYGWSSRAECEARCTAKKISLACDSKPPHKLHEIRRY
jgi:hypothetical protein